MTYVVKNSDKKQINRIYKLEISGYILNINNYQKIKGGALKFVIIAQKSRILCVTLKRNFLEIIAGFQDFDRNWNEIGSAEFNLYRKISIQQIAQQRNMAQEVHIHEKKQTQ